MRVSCRELQEGTTLAADAIDSKGRLIVAQGTVLEERHLKGLRAWGVGEVEICCEDGVELSETPPPPLDPEAEARIRGRFRHTELEDEVMQRVLELSLQRAARRAARS